MIHENSLCAQAKTLTHKEKQWNLLLSIKIFLASLFSWSCNDFMGSISGSLVTSAPYIRTGQDQGSLCVPTLMTLLSSYRPQHLLESRRLSVSKTSFSLMSPAGMMRSYGFPGLLIINMLAKGNLWKSLPQDIVIAPGLDAFHRGLNI